MNNYTMTIDKKTRFVIMYKGEVIKKYWSLSDARDFLDFAENQERAKCKLVVNTSHHVQEIDYESQTNCYGKV